MPIQLANMIAVSAGIEPSKVERGERAHRGDEAPAIIGGRRPILSDSQLTSTPPTPGVRPSTAITRLIVAGSQPRGPVK
jgi:hypothetical protein